MIPDKGHGPIVLHQNEDGSVQLRDNLSRLWCACGQPAVEYFISNEAPHDFQCIKHAYETRKIMNRRLNSEELGSFLT